MSQARLILLVVQKYVHLHMIKFTSLDLHTNTYTGMVSFLSFLRILHFPVETLICFKIYTSSKHKNTSLWFFQPWVASSPFSSRSDMCLSSFGVREHQLRSDTARPHRRFLLYTTPPLCVIVAVWNCTLSSCIRSATKIPKRVGLSMLPSGTPRRMWTLLLVGIRRWRTRTLTTWNLSLRCFHIRPTIFSLHKSERSLPQWILGNAVEKSQNATYVARPRWDMLYCMRESRQYIASWTCQPGCVPSWFCVSVLWVSVNLVSR